MSKKDELNEKNEPWDQKIYDEDENGMSRSKGKGSNSLFVTLLVALLGLAVIVTFAAYFWMMKPTGKKPVAETPKTTETTKKKDKKKESSTTETSTTETTTSSTTEAPKEEEKPEQTPEAEQPAQQEQPTPQTPQAEQPAQQEQPAPQQNQETPQQNQQQNQQPVQAGGTYSVEKGQGPWRVATENGMTVAELQQLNPGVDINNLHPGQVLNVK